MSLVWKDPKEELPNSEQLVWIMLAPHKWRDSMENSMQSIQIVCGEIERTNEYCHVVNHDELGYGSERWALFDASDDFSTYQKAIAWVSADKMPLPNWKPIWVKE
jgi:hypothetical protein